MAAALVEELVEEVLLRFPPDDSASLVRAALVCKPWCRLVAGDGFRRRYRVLHRTPPLLGFSYVALTGDDQYIYVTGRFAPATSFRPPPACPGWRAVDARHGRVLLTALSSGDERLFVLWDPIADAQHPFRMPHREPISWNAAVLCAAAGACDHLDCHRGPFHLVFVCTGYRHVSVHVYSSQSRAWSKASVQLHLVEHFCKGRGVLVGNELHFMFHGNLRVLRYEMGTQEISFTHVPRACSSRWRPAVLMTTDDGMLGFANVLESKLHLWSLKVGPNGCVAWTPSRVIALDTLLTVDACATSPQVVGFADDARVFFMWTDNGLFIIDLKCGQVRKACEDKNIHIDYNVVPYASFCLPALKVATTGEGPSKDA